MVDKKKIKLRLLQEKYIAQLPEKMSLIHSSWLAQQLDSNNIKASSDLIRHIHTLAGSAGTFGFSRLSEQARCLEILLNRLLNDTGLNRDILDSVAKTIEQLDFLVSQGPDIKQRDVVEQKIEQSTPITELSLVYIVEDDTLLAEEIKQHLQTYGYQVELFSHADLVLEAMQQHLPNVMLVDVELPEGALAGPELMTKFNAIATENIPLIFMSVREDWEARLAVVRAGGDAYIIKPIDFSELLDNLENLLCVREIESYRILVVDDTEILAEHYKLILQNSGMQVKVITNPSYILDAVIGFKPELILMDIYMPECSGLEAAKVIRQKQELLGVPIVFLSTETNTEQQLLALKVGGDDFLQKPISDNQLIESVLIRVERFRKLNTLMHQDSLTGLYNHVTIKMHLESEIARTVRRQTSLVFVMLDIDNFKLINDTYGHPVGDRVIKSLSRLLTQRFRKSDIIGRYGGEEFAVILPDTTISNAIILLDDIRKQFFNIKQQHDEIQFSCSFSAGLAAVPTFIDTASLIRAADDALLQAKQEGRNQIKVLAKMK